MPLLMDVVLIFWMQNVSSEVVVGLTDGQQLSIANPVFGGFIETRAEGEPFLLYRQANLHGEISTRSVARIDFEKYKKGKPLSMKVTLKNGQTMEVQSDRRDFVTLKGGSNIGMITVRHPDPISPEMKLSTRKPNRKDDLTIQYLEFPAP